MTPEEVPDELVMPLVWAGAEESETRTRIALAITERQRQICEQAEQAESDAPVPKPPCAACGKTFTGHVRRGWCPGCYARWYRAGRPETGPPPMRTRTIACKSCESTSGKFTRGWCPRCYERWLRAGKPEAGPPALQVRQPRVDQPTVSRLREMLTVARTVTGGMSADHPARMMSVQFTAELQALVERGVTPYELAKVLCLGPQTVYVRLARHGYRTPAPSQAASAYKGRKIGDRS